MTTCSKNGIKKEGESCSLNNNCTYPGCLEKTFTEKDMIDFALYVATVPNTPYKTIRELLQEFLIRKQ